jgi:hypothetical protein
LPLRQLEEVDMNAVRTQDAEAKTARVRRRDVGDIAVTAIASVAIALPLVFYLHQHVEILRLGYDIESLKDRRLEISESSRELRVKRMESASFARVEEQASLLGLVAPDPSDIYIARGHALPRGGAAPVAESEPKAQMTARLE